MNGDVQKDGDENGEVDEEQALGDDGIREEGKGGGEGEGRRRRDRRKVNK